MPADLIGCKGNPLSRGGVTKCERRRERERRRSPTAGGPGEEEGKVEFNVSEVITVISI